MYGENHIFELVHSVVERVWLAFICTSSATNAVVGTAATHSAVRQLSFVPGGKAHGLHVSVSAVALTRR